MRGMGHLSIEEYYKWIVWNESIRNWIIMVECMVIVVGLNVFGSFLG